MSLTKSAYLTKVVAVLVANSMLVPSVAYGLPMTPRGSSSQQRIQLPIPQPQHPNNLDQLQDVPPAADGQQPQQQVDQQVDQQKQLEEHDKLTRLLEWERKLCDECCERSEAEIKILNDYVELLKTKLVIQQRNSKKKSHEQFLIGACIGSAATIVGFLLRHFTK